MNYARFITEIDRRIDDDPTYISELTVGTGFALPVKPKWKWHLHYLDLGLLEKASGAFLLFKKGPN